MSKPILLPNESPQEPTKLNKQGLIEKAIKNRQLKMACITPETLLSITNSKQFFKTELEGLPEDALAVGVTMHSLSQTLMIIIASNSFESITPGAQLPLLKGTVKTKECQCSK